jgi:mannose-6-phosphate isomerase
MPFAIEGVIRHYGWGSPTTLPKLLGIEVDGQPAAELWFGAHPDDPSATARGTLDELIAADPEALLGAGQVARFGPQLPYLVKILAAARCLSIQVHPTLEQARTGFAAEDAAGIARDAVNRNYRDTNHKPELLCALTPFDALCGFRPVAQTRDVLAEIAIPELDFVAELLAGPDPLRAAFTALLAHPDPAPLADAVARRAEGATDGPLYAAAIAASDYPGDVGVALSLLLNHVRLQPGEAIYLGAGNVHAYLRGTGVEIMANSDNVLRCGLTTKHIDPAQVLAITEFVELTEPRSPSHVGRFDVSIPDFALTRLELDEPTGLDDRGPCIVLCTSGQVFVDELELSPAHAAFVAAGERVILGGSGEAFVGGVGRPS